MNTGLEVTRSDLRVDWSSVEELALPVAAEVDSEVVSSEAAAEELTRWWEASVEAPDEVTEAMILDLRARRRSRGTTGVPSVPPDHFGAAVARGEMTNSQQGTISKFQTLSADGIGRVLVNVETRLKKV